MAVLTSRPFEYVSRTELGPIFRPHLIVKVFSKASKDWLAIKFVVDSGADYTLLPQRYLNILGIFAKDCKAVSSSGIGGSEIVYQYKNLPIKISDWKHKVPVGFMSHNNIPALLGRLKCLEDLRVIFDKSIISLEIDS